MSNLKFSRPSLCVSSAGAACTCSATNAVAARPSETFEMASNRLRRLTPSLLLLDILVPLLNSKCAAGLVPGGGTVANRLIYSFSGAAVLEVLYWTDQTVHLGRVRPLSAGRPGAAAACYL